MPENTDFRRYLASQILSHEKTTTYRVLSRALKVHVNTAKQMLYEYQKFQNDVKPNSVYATYLIYGTKREEQPCVNGDGDVEMSGSAADDDLEPLSDAVHTSTLTLVAEADLKDALSQYENVSSVHVYSLGPHPARDPQLLSNAQGQLGESVRDIEPVDGPKTYGTISNTNAKKRSRQGRGPVASAPVQAKAPTPKARLGKSVETSAVKSDSKESNTRVPSSSAGTEKKSTSSAGAPRGASGSIFQSFAKAAAKKTATPKPKAETTAPAAEDSPVFAMSDDGEDDDFAVKPAASAKGGRKSRQQRQDDLRRMMEEDDDDTEGKASDRGNNDDTPDADSPMGDSEETDQAPSQEFKKEDPEPAEVVSSSSNGRRRGRRRVMKKKSVMDEEGYFVTVQEEAWESFSEEEAPPSRKPKTATPSSSAGSVKTKKSGAKGQGNIMSFFAKK